MEVTKKKILNLGCGDLPIKDAVNIDTKKFAGVDEVVDLSVLPWKWEDNSIDGIFMLHTLEHFPDALSILKECHHVLKKGGFLYLQIPHSSSCSGVGVLDHYRTFGYDTFKNFLCCPNYLFNNPLFKCEISKIVWWNLSRNNRHPYIKFSVGRKTTAYPLLYFFFSPVIWIIQGLIDRFGYTKGRVRHEPDVGQYDNLNDIFLPVAQL